MKFKVNKIIKITNRKKNERKEEKEVRWSSTMFSELIS